MTSVFFLDASPTRRGGALLRSTPRRALFALLAALALLALGRARASAEVRSAPPVRVPPLPPPRALTAAAPTTKSAAATPQPAALSTVAGSRKVEPGWGALLTASTCRALLAIIITMTAMAVAPAAWGWESSVIRTGSMAPAVRVGDVLVVRPATADQLVPGQVLVVEDPDHAGQLRAHRLVSIGADGMLELKGDANQAADSTPVDPDDVRGVGVINVPKVGMVDVWVSSQDWEKLAACLLAVLLLEAGRRCDKTRKPKAVTRSRARRLVLVGPARAVALSLLVLVAASGSDKTYAAFTSKTLNSTSTIATNSTFYPYRDAVLADSPNRYWRLGEASGTTAADSSVNNRTGTYSGTYALGQPSALNWEATQRSVSFSAGALVANTSEAAPDVFSIEALIKTNSTAGGRILGFGNKNALDPSNKTDRHLWMGPLGRIGFGVESNTQKHTAVSTATYNDNAWHHVVATYGTGAGVGLRLYVDGQQVATNTTVFTPAANTGYWRAAFENMTGWPPTPTGHYFAGQIDEIAIYYSVLTPARVLAHYNAAIMP